MSPRARLTRLAALAGFILVLLVVAEHFGLRQQLHVTQLREAVVHAGALGVALYAGAFIVGMLIHVPGLIFVAAGVIIWGQIWGALFAWLGAVLAIAVSFLVARAIGGQALWTLRPDWLLPFLERLDRRPVRTVALLRAVSAASAGATLFLALSRVRFWPMLLGSALGLVPPLVLAALFLERLLGWIGH